MEFEIYPVIATTGMYILSIFVWDYIITTQSLLPMRSLYIFCLLLFSLPCFSQMQAETDVLLTLKKNDTVTSMAQSKAVLSVRDLTDDFTASIELFPIVPNPDTEDSLEQQRKPLTVKLTGHFPVDNIDFLSTADNGKTYQMETTIRINDIVQQTNLSFALPVLQNNAVDPNGNVPKYNANMSFALVLQPEKFGLNLSPFNIDKLIVVEIRNGILNKAN
ncbi:MAG: hypothetical protein QM791_00480 [Ferruginibacter sp.]